MPDKNDPFYPVKVRDISSSPDAADVRDADSLTLSFAPSDCHAYILIPIYSGARIVRHDQYPLGEVLLFSLSSHRDKFPVSRLGRMLPVGFTAGRRTVAGSIGVVLWDRHVFRKITDDLFMAYPHYVGRPHADELPPFDMVLVFVNEYGQTVALNLYGVTLLDEGMSMSTDDSRSVVTYSYMAVDYSLDTAPLTERLPEEGDYQEPEIEDVEVSHYEVNGERALTREHIISALPGVLNTSGALAAGILLQFTDMFATVLDELAAQSVEIPAQ